MGLALQEGEWQGDPTAVNSQMPSQQQTQVLPAPCRRIPARPKPPAGGETPAYGAAAVLLLPERQKEGEMLHVELSPDTSASAGICFSCNTADFYKVGGA